MHPVVYIKEQFKCLSKLTSQEIVLVFVSRYYNTFQNIAPPFKFLPISFSRQCMSSKIHFTIVENLRRMHVDQRIKNSEARRERSRYLQIYRRATRYRKYGHHFSVPATSNGVRLQFLKAEDAVHRASTTAI